MTEEGAGNTIPLLEIERNSIEQPPSGQDTQRFDDVLSPITGEDEIIRPKKHTTLVQENIKSRKKAFSSTLIHIPPVAITLGILSLTFWSVFWTQPTEEMNTFLNLLQFAAQAHGILIVGSLSAMLLHLVHMGLASKAGIPLGFVSSSFQLSSITYLFRKEFTTLQIRYILLFWFAFTLAIFSNPSSAIVMLPRLQFWPIRNQWLNKGKVEFSAYIAASEKDLYPQTLTANHLPPSCFQNNASLEEECPSNGMRHWILENDLFYHPAASSGSKTINKTIQGSWLRYLNGQSSGVQLRTQSIYITTTLSNFLGNILFAYGSSLKEFGRWGRRVVGIDEGPLTLENGYSDQELATRYDLFLRVDGKTIPSKKPLVMVECGGFSADISSLPLFHDRMFWSPWDTEPIYSADWRVEKTAFSDLITDLNSTIVKSTTIDIEQFGSVKPSLGIFYSTPEVIIPGKGCYGCKENRNTNYSMDTCTVDARWLSTRAFSDASYGGARAIFDFNPSPITDAVQENSRKREENIPSIFISQSWAEAIKVPWIDSLLDPQPTNRSMLDIIGQKCLDANTFYNATNQGQEFADGRLHRMTTDPTRMLTCLQTNLAITITEAVSRLQDHIPTYFVADATDIPVTRPKYYDSNAFMVANLFGDKPQSSLKMNITNDGWIRNFTRADFADTSRFTELYMPATRWGYGYGFHDSILVCVGAALLLVHVTLSLAFVIWILWRGDYRDEGWKTIGGLVTLAMKSGTEDEGILEEVPLGWGKRKERKAMWRRKWAGKVAVRELRSGEVGGDAGFRKGGMDGSVLVLRRVGEYEGRESDLEGSGRSNETIDGEQERRSVP